MPSPSPSQVVRRPSLQERNSSNQSLSSSSRQTNIHKVHRTHTLGRHARNASHGKNLSKLAKIQSTASIVSENRNHQRKKSGGTTSPTSPKPPDPRLKRNSSHVVVLPKNTSHTNLRKNNSTTALAALPRNRSHPTLAKKVGLAPAPAVADEKKQGFFVGAEGSDEEEEEEEEWEDTATQSPEFTRDNSKVSTPARIGTPNNENRLPDGGFHKPRMSSPPLPSLKANRMSAPDLSKYDFASEPSQPDPAQLQRNPRSSRAPPAMSTVSVHADHINLSRNGSTRSFARAEPENADSVTKADGSRTMASSSGNQAVSHFLTESEPRSESLLVDDESDSDVSNFMSSYKPQPSESPEKLRHLHKPVLPHVPSRTLQKLELQRRETMRAAVNTPTTPPPGSMRFSVGSSGSMHSRSGSRGRNRAMTGDMKAPKEHYEAAMKQLAVVRRFRNPIFESLARLKNTNILPAETGSGSSSNVINKSRPQSRRGFNATNANGHLRPAVSRSLEDNKTSPLASRASSRGRGARVQFQMSRQGSHDDIGLSAPTGHQEGNEEDDQDGIAPAEALIRRMWESREVYHPDEGMAR